MILFCRSLSKQVALMHLLKMQSAQTDEGIFSRNMMVKRTNGTLAKRLFISKGREENTEKWSKN